MRSTLLTRSLLLFGLLLLVANFEVIAQNSSYNANNIPVGGNFNIAFGVDALKVTTGQRNLAIGRNALGANTSGFFNIGIGENALAGNTEAGFNVAIGYKFIRRPKLAIVVIGPFILKGLLM